jgi:cyclophilin family peptidyl-prolyl cis-trans isomerase
MRSRLLAPCLCLFLLATLRVACASLVYASPVTVVFNTNLGNITVKLLTTTPQTTANFLNYVDSGAYNDSIIHRSVPGFVIQGGGYFFLGNNLDAITANAAVPSEAGTSNTRGTLAMALSTGPASGTNEWFFNLVDNSSSLDGTSDGGPFTVFGTIATTDSASLAIMDKIAGETVYDASSLFGSDFTNLPLINYDSTVGLEVQNFVTINSITRSTVQNLSAWQTANFPGQPATVSGPAAMPKNDGVPNLLKYLCDINPKVPMSAADHAKLPTGGTTSITASGVTTQYVTLTYHQYALKTGITVSVQTSSDLQTWTTVSNPTIVAVGNDTTTANNDPIFQVQVPATGTEQFLRLNVTQP